MSVLTIRIFGYFWSRVLFYRLLLELVSNLFLPSTAFKLFIFTLIFVAACIKVEVQKLLVVFLEVLVEFGVLLRKFREFNEMRLALV